MKYSDEKYEITYDINYSIEDFFKRNKKAIYKSKGKEEIQITPTLYKKIIIKFLKIWLYDFLWSKGPYYFFLTGSMHKFKFPGKVDIDRKTGNVKEFKTKIGIDWRRRNISKFYTYYIKKRTGKTNLFPAAEREWNKYNDVESLLTLNELIKSQTDKEKK